MKNLPTMKQLEYLTALVSKEHFGKAAEVCHVTPSTLSAGIKDLERVLQTKIAERNKRRVRITDLGKDIAKRSQSILRDAEDIVKLAATHNQPMTGNLNLGVIPTIGPFLLPKVLSHLHSKYPEYKIFADEDISSNLLEKLQIGKLDVLLIALPYPTPNFQSRILFEDEFFFACDKNHALAKVNSVSIENLDTLKLILLKEGHCLRTHVLDICRAGNSTSNKVLETNNLHTLVQMVASGFGPTLLPKIAIDRHITQGTNIKIKPLKPNLGRGIGLVWRPSSLKKQDFMILGDTIKNIAH